MKKRPRGRLFQWGKVLAASIVSILVSCQSPLAELKSASPSAPDGKPVAMRYANSMVKAYQLVGSANDATQAKSSFFDFVRQLPVQDAKGHQVAFSSLAASQKAVVIDAWKESTIANMASGNSQAFLDNLSDNTSAIEAALIGLGGIADETKFVELFQQEFSKRNAARVANGPADGVAASRSGGGGNGGGPASLAAFNALQANYGQGRILTSLDTNPDTGLAFGHTGMMSNPQWDPMWAFDPEKANFSISAWSNPTGVCYESLMDWARTTNWIQNVHITRVRSRTWDLGTLNWKYTWANEAESAQAIANAESWLGKPYNLISVRETSDGTDDDDFNCVKVAWKAWKNVAAKFDLIDGAPISVTTLAGRIAPADIYFNSGNMNNSYEVANYSCTTPALIIGGKTYYEQDGWAGSDGWSAADGGPALQTSLGTLKVGTSGSLSRPMSISDGSRVVMRVRARDNTTRTSNWTAWNTGSTTSSLSSSFPISGNWSIVTATFGTVPSRTNLLQIYQNNIEIDWITILTAWKDSGIWTARDGGLVLDVSSGILSVGAGGSIGAPMTLSPGSSVMMRVRSKSNTTSTNTWTDWNTGSSQSLLSTPFEITDTWSTVSANFDTVVPGMDLLQLYKNNIEIDWVRAVNASQVARYYQDSWANLDSWYAADSGPALTASSGTLKVGASGSLGRMMTIPANSKVVMRVRSRDNTTRTTNWTSWNTGTHQTTSSTTFPISGTWSTVTATFASLPAGMDLLQIYQNNIEIDWVYVDSN